MCFLCIFASQLNFMDKKAIHILQESKKRFDELGLRSVSMEDISRELRISKKTLYQYFKNKVQLIEKMMDYLDEIECQQFAYITDGHFNAIDGLLEISKIVNTTFHMFNPGFSFDLQKYYPEIYQKVVTKKRKETAEYILNNLEQGIREGLYRKELNSPLITELYIKKLENMNDREFINSTEYSFQTIFEVVFENHIRAIANPDGIKYFEEKKKSLPFNTTIND